MMKMGYNVYLTGEAGTGKTYVLSAYIAHLRKRHIPFAVTASTGIAATHLDGVTIDSWSGLGIRDTITAEDLHEIAKKYHLRHRLQSTKVLIIDEISMIGGKRFDAIDQILRYVRGASSETSQGMPSGIPPFGGLQVILCGDLFQLPPVMKDNQVIDYIFRSQAWNDLQLNICYLKQPRRQSDHELLQILRDIRHNQVTDSTRDILSRILHHPPPPAFSPTKLYTHNIDVDAINEQHIQALHGEPHTYYMTILGPEKLTTMMKRSCLAPPRLELKKDALVMFVRNNYEQGYVNGTMGKVTGFNENDDPVVKTYDGKTITVGPAQWTIKEDEKIIAQITQHPLRPAWAITVHKSQGMTLDAAEIDLSKSFVEGMGYVALSRVKSLKGLRLLGINNMALRVHPEVSAFDEQLHRQSEQTARQLHALGWLRRWWKKWKFINTLTS